jgi:hypothetical protein
MMSRRIRTAGVVAADGAAADMALDVVDGADVLARLTPEPVDVLRLRCDLRVALQYAVEHGVLHPGR